MLVNNAVFSPDGNYVVTTSLDGRANVWDAKTGGKIATHRGHQCAINSAEFSPDGRHVVTASDDGAAQVWKVKNGEMVADLRTHRGLLISRTFTGGTTRALLLHPFALKSFPYKFDLKHREGKYVWLYSAKFSADETRVVTADAQGTVRIWAVKGAKPISELHGFAGAAFNAEFSRDGGFVVAGSEGRTARVWDSGEDKKPAPERSCPALRKD